MKPILLQLSENYNKWRVFKDRHIRYTFTVSWILHISYNIVYEDNELGAMTIRAPMAFYGMN